METFDKKPRGRKGEGRSVLFKPVNLPVEVAEDLKLYKSIYETVYPCGKDEWGNPIPARFSYAQILSHWMKQVASFDPEIARGFAEAKRQRAIASHSVDPTEGDVWDMEYLFVNDHGDELEAIPDECGTFVADMNGFKATAESMMLNDWTLLNDAGVEINAAQAKAIASRILSHRKGSE